jgi:iron complex outermembrane receptor protein
MLKSVTFRSTLAAVAWAISFSVFAMANGPTRVDIPAGNLVPALEALEKQVAIELVFQPEQLKSFRTKGVKGTYEPKDAVRLLLKGTSLELRTDPTGAMVIVQSHTAVSRAQTQSQAVGDTGQATDSRSGLQLAQATPGATANSTSAGPRVGTFNEGKNEAGIQEVIVTAQKRSERLEDVPIPVTAIPAQSLVDNGLLEMKDYYSLLPSVNYSAGSANGFYPNGGAVSIRGVFSAPGTPATVSSLVDDVPFGPTTAFSITGVPDIDPGELDHIEVLRGPQGALYGAGSMGGLVKYVTRDPSTDEWSGRLQWGNSTVYNGAELGYEGRGSVNVPVSSDFAIRGSGFARLDPGYIDNPVLNQDGLNKTEAGGGRLVSLWKPSEAFALTLSGLIQDTRDFGSPEVDVGPGLGDLQQNRIPGTGTMQQKIQVYSATIKAKLGTADLTSVTAWNRLFTDVHNDFSYAQPTWTVPLNSDTDRFTQELRLSVPIETWVDWLIGGFYDHEGVSGTEVVNTEAANGAVTGIVETIDSTATYTEGAAFTDLTFHLTNQLDLQLGGRATDLEQRTGGSVSAGGHVNLSPTLESHEHPLTYLVTPSFKATEDFMVYARFASGFRPGGANSPLSVSGGAPATYNPDYTKTYDLGVKGDFLDRKLSVDAAAFYIDWKDLQLQFQTPQFYGYSSNGGAAKSEGLELSVEAKPVGGLTITGWIDWDDAVITEASPPGSTKVLLPGVRLPFVSRFSGNISVAEQFPLSAGWTSLIAGNLSYVGDRPNSTGTLKGPAEIFPSYARLDLRAALQKDLWTVNFFVDNVTDKRGLIGGGPGNNNPNAFYYIQPRTIGMSLARDFQ